MNAFHVTPSLTPVRWWLVNGATRFASPYVAMRDFVRRLSCNGDIVVNKLVAESEYEHRSRNAAMAYLMKSHGNFENEVEDAFEIIFTTVR